VCMDGSGWMGSVSIIRRAPPPFHIHVDGWMEMDTYYGSIRSVRLESPFRFHSH
jgi:hypothetical protein